MTKRILVLGSNSFAGAQYVYYAMQSNQVRGINRSDEGSELFLPYKQLANQKNYQFLQLDINKDFAAICEFLDAYQPHVVVDFAGQGMVAESWQAPHQWYQTNIVSKVRLHQFLSTKSWLEKYIRISTPEVYGSSSSLIDETAQYNPSTPYAVSHAAIDMSLKAYFQHYGFPVVFTRFSNFYGPSQQLYRIIPRTIIYALTGQKLMLHGGGTATRAFIHGKDVAQAITCCIENGKLGETYHFSTDDFVTIKQLVQRIHVLMDIDHQSATENTQDRPGKDLRYLMDDSKARKTLKWTPTVELASGLSGTIDWVKANLSEIKTLPMNYQHKE